MGSHAISSAHLVSPVNRCGGGCTRPRDAYDAPIGAAPFDRFLQANNQAKRGFDQFELSKARTPDEHTSSMAASQNAHTSASLLPKLGEVLMPKPRPQVAATESKVYQQQIPATGRALDIYA